MVSQILLVMIAAIAVAISAGRRNIQAPLLLTPAGLAPRPSPACRRGSADALRLCHGDGDRATSSSRTAFYFGYTIVIGMVICAVVHRTRTVLELGRAVLKARRTALVAARDARKFDDDELREIMEEIDLQQAVLANWEPGRFSS